MPDRPTDRPTNRRTKVFIGNNKAPRRFLCFSFPPCCTWRFNHSSPPTPCFILPPFLRAGLNFTPIFNPQPPPPNQTLGDQEASEEIKGKHCGRSQICFCKFNKCSDRSMEVKLPALLGNYERQTDRPTDGFLGKFNFH